VNSHCRRRGRVSRPDTDQLILAENPHVGHHLGGVGEGAPRAKNLGRDERESSGGAAAVGERGDGEGRKKRDGEGGGDEGKF